jgi:hypothetical protein
MILPSECLREEASDRCGFPAKPLVHRGNARERVRRWKALTSDSSRTSGLTDPTDNSLEFDQAYVSSGSDSDLGERRAGVRLHVESGRNLAQPVGLVSATSRLGAEPGFFARENVVCVTPDDFGYWGTLGQPAGKGGQLSRASAQPGHAPSLDHHSFHQSGVGTNAIRAKPARGSQLGSSHSEPAMKP